ncbi:MAG: efflux RND transporter periplasmic adaptor subunit [Deltaproteobacteria bacterium]|nr:efflux RND transporter periplasmic adaptor subunit [Deltaproteobacteria bacterium]
MKDPSTPSLSSPPSSAANVAALIGVESSRRGWRFWMVVLVVMALVVSLGVWGRARFRDVPPPSWKTAAVDRGDIRVTVTATGQLEPLSVVIIGAEINGRIASVDVDFNDQVKAGQVLARIDTETLNTQLKQSVASLEAAQATVHEARATRTEAKKNVSRALELSRAGVASNSQRETAEASYARAEAALASAIAQQRLAQARVDSVRTDISKAVLKSPIDGVVLQRNIEPGNTVVATLQSPTLFEVAADLRRMRLYADIDEADVGRVAAGQKATFTVDAWPNRRFSAEVVSVRLAPTVTNNVVSYKAVLAVSNEDGMLRPGMTATVDIIAKTEVGVLRVPNTALRFEPPKADAEPSSRGFSFGPPRPFRQGGSSEQPRVFVLEEGRLEQVRVTPGVSDGRWTAVEEGPAGGEGQGQDREAVPGGGRSLQVGDLVVIGTSVSAALASP